jgi:hypothetical protein
MELFITLRFRQGWWTTPEAKELLPEWVNNLDIKTPKGVLDCRLKNNCSKNMFIEQICLPEFPWIVLPGIKAGPDIRYSVFCCYIKTTFTPNSKSSMYVGTEEESRKNEKTMDKTNWYQSQASLSAKCQEVVKHRRFVHMRFELPWTATSLKKGFQDNISGSDTVIFVDLDSKIAGPIFGEKFIVECKDFFARKSLDKNKSRWKGVHKILSNLKLIKTEKIKARNTENKSRLACLC